MFLPFILPAALCCWRLREVRFRFTCKVCVPSATVVPPKEQTLLVTQGSKYLQNN